MFLPLLLTSEQALKKLSSAPAGVLAAVEYGERQEMPSSALHIWVPLRTQGDEGRVELWPARGRVHTELESGVRVSYDGERLLGAIPLPELSEAGHFEEVIRAAYTAMTEVCGAHGYPHPLRVWNFIPGIHEMHAGLDRYQAFCLARHDPLARYLDLIGDGFPAATVVGTRTREGVMYFLAARQPGRHLENPRQVPATEYPGCYGPRSPSFSRATLAGFGQQAALYISGTGSIVGHESRHGYDTVLQTQEILRNLQELIQAAGCASGLDFRGLQDIVRARVYLRNLAEAPAVLALLQRALPGARPILCHEGDLCRRELMVEIEGIAVPGAGHAAASHDKNTHSPIAKT